MTPHKHHDLIVAWAKGAQIQVYSELKRKWMDYTHGAEPIWLENFQYRIKPEPKPDVVLYGCISLLNYDTASIQPVNADTRKLKTDTCMFVFDGETGKLKKAEVINEA